MNTLERASRQLVAEPVANPTPLETIRSRATQLRRRRSAAVAVLAAVVLVIAASGIALTRTHPSPHVSTVVPPTTMGQLHLGPGTPFVPRTSVEGDQTILPITLLNGDTISLGYPSQLAIAELGFTPGTAVNWQPDGYGSPCCGRNLEVRHGTIDEVFAGREPEKVYPGNDGRGVPYFTGSDLDYLAFQIGDWVVAVPDGLVYRTGDMAMTDEERTVYAANLTGHQTPDGYLVLTPSLPLTLGHAGASASFGDNALDLIYRNCTAPTPPSYNANDFTLEAQNDESGTWLCYRSTPVVVHAGGSQTFQAQVADSLRIVANHQEAYG